MRGTRLLGPHWFIMGIIGTFTIAVFCGATGVKITQAQTVVATDTTPIAETPVDPSTQKQAVRTALENELQDLENQIAENQKTIDQYSKQGKTLKGDISTLNAKITQLNLKIKQVTLSISNLNEDINSTQRDINQTENKIDQQKNTIARALQTLYEADMQNTLEILLGNDTLSDFFGTINNMALLQETLRTSLIEIRKARQELLTQKSEYESKKEDAENLRAIQQSQKKGVELTQKQKADLLKATKGKEAEYQKLLKQNQTSAAQIRSRLFELLGGGELTFEKAYNYAKLAEGASGVRASLILAILNRESLLGKNVGRCGYKTAMHPTRDIPYFLDLLAQLHMDPNSTTAKVSCANAHGAYGGAMGPAQFIPSTWKLYAPKITAITKNDPPNPWNNADAFVATGVYIRDLMDSQSCIDYSHATGGTDNQLRERCAAAKYYAGAKWYTYRFWYGDPVVVQANSYEKDIALIKTGA